MGGQPSENGKQSFSCHLSLNCCSSRLGHLGPALDLESHRETEPQDWSVARTSLPPAGGSALVEQCHFEWVRRSTFPLLEGQTSKTTPIRNCSTFTVLIELHIAANPTHFTLPVVRAEMGRVASALSAGVVASSSLQMFNIVCTGQALPRQPPLVLNV